MNNSNIVLKINNTKIKSPIVGFATFLLLACSFYVSTAHSYSRSANEIVNPPPKTAIEIMINKRIPESTLNDNRPAHVYRPRTPIYHKHHPENKPTPPVIKRHLLVDHPELNNNQGRNIRSK